MLTPPAAVFRWSTPHATLPRWRVADVEPVRAWLASLGGYLATEPGHVAECFACRLDGIHAPCEVLNVGRRWTLNDTGATMTPESVLSSVAGKTAIDPIHEARVQLAHLVGAIAYADDHFAKTGVHLQIKTDEAAVCAESLRRIRDAGPAPIVPRVNHPVIVALRKLAGSGDAGCMFGQVKHHPDECDRCYAKFALDCIEHTDGRPLRIARWLEKHPHLQLVTLEGLALP